MLNDLLLDLEHPVGAMCAFLHSPDHQTGVLKVIHAPRRFTSVPGRATPARGKAFACSGDVEGIDVDTIALDIQQLELTAEIHIPGDWDCMLEMFNNEPNNELLDPIEKKVKEKKTVRTRSIVFLPFPMVQHVLEKDLNARESFTVLYPATLPCRAWD